MDTSETSPRRVEDLHNMGEIEAKSSGRLQLILGEVQVVLAEKRTALSVVRLGIAIEALPLSIIGLLIATSRFYSPADVLHLLIPLLAACLSLAVLGGYLVVRGVRHLHRHDGIMAELKKQLPMLSQLLD